MPEGTGVYDTGTAGKLPPKQPGKHRWLSLQTYTVTDEQIATAAAGVADITLDHENRIGSLIGCVDCGQSLDQAIQYLCPTIEVG